VLNARIRRNWLASRMPVGVVGPEMDLTYDAEHLGDGPALLGDILSGKSKFAAKLKRAKRPMIIIGMGALARPDGAAILGQAHAIADAYGVVAGDWNGFNVLHSAAARVAGLDLGLIPGRGGLDVAGIYKAATGGKLDLVWLQAADEIDEAKLEKTFVVYQGHNGDRGAHVADVILPGAAYTEKDGIYLNTEGRAQYAARATFPPGEAREDWTIIRALAGRLGINLGFDTIDELREAMFEVVPHFADQDEIRPARWAKFGAGTKLSSEPISAALENFYMTCAISRASQTMGQCLMALQADAARDAAE
jgi:NADH-quinone oxidoreductase subunit G